MRWRRTAPSRAARRMSWTRQRRAPPTCPTICWDACGRHRRHRRTGAEAEVVVGLAPDARRARVVGAARVVPGARVRRAPLVDCGPIAEVFKANIENESSVSDEERTEGWTVSAPAPVEDELIGSMGQEESGDQPEGEREMRAAALIAREPAATTGRARRRVSATRKRASSARKRSTAGRKTTSRKRKTTSRKRQTSSRKRSGSGRMTVRTAGSRGGRKASARKSSSSRKRATSSRKRSTTRSPKTSSRKSSSTRSRR